MFNGFKKKFVKVSKGKIFCRFKGNGPPLIITSWISPNTCDVAQDCP